MGRPKEFVNKVRMEVKIEKTLKDNFTALCNAKKVNKSLVMRELLERYLKDNGYQ